MQDTTTRLSRLKYITFVDLKLQPSEILPHGGRAISIWLALRELINRMFFVGWQETLLNGKLRKHFLCHHRINAVP